MTGDHRDQVAVAAGRRCARRSGPGAEIRIRAAGPALARRVRGRVARARPPRARDGPVRRAAARRHRRRAGREHPRRRLADRRGGAHPRPGDGRPRHRGRDAARQGAARLPGLRAAPARRAPPDCRRSACSCSTARSAGRSPRRSPPSSSGSPGREVALLVDPPALVFDEEPVDLPAPAAGLGPRPQRRQRGPRGPCRGPRRAAPVRRAGDPRGGPGRGRRRAVARRPARRPRAVRLTRPGAAAGGAARQFGYPRDRCPPCPPRSASCTTLDPARDPSPRRPPGRRRAPGRPAVPRRRPRRGQDAVFAKGFAAGLGVTDTVSSPTFVLMAEYAGRLPLFHLDLYRLDDAADALAGGLLDERQAEGVTLVEWAERLGAGAAREPPRRRDRRDRRRAAPDRAALRRPGLRAATSRPRRDRRRPAPRHRHRDDARRRRARRARRRR